MDRQKDKQAHTYTHTLYLVLCMLCTAIIQQDLAYIESQLSDPLTIQMLH